MENASFDKNLIAPCGMNCGVCIAYLRKKKPCGGCRIRSNNKPKHCISCVIVNCDHLTGTESGFCIDCPHFPCRRMKSLDLRYRKNYHTSLIDNQKQIKAEGMQSFLWSESCKWLCPYCGKTTSIHRDICLNCKKEIDTKE